MKGFIAYQKYIAIMMHFSDKSNYDYFKYNGKTKANLESFKANKKNVYKYGGIEKRVGLDELESFFFFNMEGGYKKFIPQTFFKTYKNTLALIDNFSVDFTTEVEAIMDMAKHEKCTYKDLFKGGENHLHPLLYTWYDRGIISRLTLLFIDLYIERVYDESNSCDPLLWKEVVDQHRHREGFYRRCYFRRLDNMEEMKEIWTNAIKKTFKVKD